MDNSRLNRNRLNFVFYRVVVSGGGFSSLEAPSDGFIDNSNTLHYAAEENIHPETIELSRAKERANARWDEIMVQTQQILAPVAVRGIEKTGTPDGSTPPDSIAFTLVYDRESYVYTPNIENEPAGVETLWGEEAVRRMVARALMSDKSANRDIYSPSMLSGSPQGMMFERIQAGPLATTVTEAEAAVEVTRLTEV